MRPWLRAPLRITSLLRLALGRASASSAEQPQQNHQISARCCSSINRPTQIIVYQVSSYTALSTIDLSASDGHFDCKIASELGAAPPKLVLTTIPSGFNTDFTDEFGGNDYEFIEHWPIVGEVNSHHGVPYYRTPFNAPASRTRVPSDFNSSTPLADSKDLVRLANENHW